MTKEIKKQQDITLFEQQEVRKKWHKEKWYFSVSDVVQILTDSKDVKQYVKKLRQRDTELSSYWGTICTPLELLSKDGKNRKETTTDIEGIFRIIQSISSPKAEPFKRWLAKVGKERIEEIANPELAVNRAKEIYEKKGYQKDWIDKRMRGIAVRNTLTDEWKERDIKGFEYAILTNEIYTGTFEQNHKSLMKTKNLDKKKGDNLRDYMGDVELILTMLAEATSTEITKSKDSKGINEIQQDVRKAGAIAGNTRKKIETETGKKVITKNNRKELK
jgi:prophage antirepressor-like protein